MMQKGKFPRLLVNYLNIVLNVVELLSDVNIMVGNGEIMIVLKYIVLIVVNWRKSLIIVIWNVLILCKLDVCNRLFFFDFETQSEGDGLCFDVYYCVVNVLCMKCKDVSFDSDGSDVWACCGSRVEIFSGDERINQFCEYRIEMDKKCKTIWVAHDGAPFGTFIMRWMLRKFNITPWVVMNGNKILCMKMLNITVLDSFVFW